MKYYTYVLIDPRTGKIFYVGKGQKLRMYAHIKDVQRGRIPNGTNRKLGNKIKKILSSGDKVKYKKVFITENGRKAFLKEKELIAEIGLKNLCNITNGGDGNNYWLGKFRSQETKQKISKSKKGIARSDETKRKISENHIGMLGKKHSKEAKKKISDSKMGQKLSEETKKKVSKNNAKYFLGKSLSNEHKRKISESKKGYKVSEETKKKISVSMKNKFLN